MIESLYQLSEIKRIISGLEHDEAQAGPGHLVVTSALEKEGKSTLATGIAVQSAARSGAKVLLLDFNWRFPKLHDFLNRKQNYDFQQLKSSPNPMQLVQSTDYQGLDLLTAPLTEDCDRFKDAVQICQNILLEAHAQYQRIIVDTGSLFPENRFMLDPLRFGHNAMGTLLVLLAGTTPRAAAKRATVLLREYEIKISGIIMNNFQNPLAHSA
ncbi:MAG: hypothetical protein R6V55_09765 [Desulfovermiculus sp.]